MKYHLVLIYQLKTAFDAREVGRWGAWGGGMLADTMQT